jgi:ribosomal protein S18 acetylase RimI-like enzyme
MTIQRINTDDLDLLEQFLAACGSSLSSFRYFQTRPLSIIQNHLTTLLGINDKNIPVAYGHLDQEGGVIWLGICVSENNQGKGFGNLMMCGLIAEALRLNLPEIHLTVDKTNINAIRLYQKYEFKMIKESDDIFMYCWKAKTQKSESFLL